MVWRSFDRGDTYVGPEYVPVIGPSLESRSEAQHGLNQFGFIGRDIAELDDGTLLVPACVRFSGDTKIPQCNLSLDRPRKKLPLLFDNDNGAGFSERFW